MLCVVDDRRPLLTPTRVPYAWHGRNCAGKQFAEPSLFIAIASVLHALVVDPPLDEQGSPRVLTYDDIKMVQSFVACVSLSLSLSPSLLRLEGLDTSTNADTNAVLLCRYPEPLEYRFRHRTKAMRTLVLADSESEVKGGL